jgi:hypothetical protein
MEPLENGANCQNQIKLRENKDLHPECVMKMGLPAYITALMWPILPNFVLGRLLPEWDLEKSGKFPLFRVSRDTSI